MTRALIDADILVYRMAYIHEQSVAWDADTWSRWADLPAAKASIDGVIKTIKEWLGADDVSLYLTDTKANWRKAVYPLYKSNRAGWENGEESLIKSPKPERPMLHKPLRSWLIEERGALWRPAFEADDLMGLEADFGVIVTIDKDLLSVPGRHFNPDRPDAGIIEVGPEEAHRRHMKQALMGDSVDGYPGCPGMGEKRSSTLLDAIEDPHELWPAIVREYEKKGMTEDDALVMARVARVLRNGDLDEHGEVILWTPERSF